MRANTEGKKTVPKADKRVTRKSEDKKTIVKGLSFIGLLQDANMAEVDVDDGKIVRVRPLHYDSKYAPDEIEGWQMEARGKVFKPKLKSLIPPFSLGYKNRVYSPNRILYPLKRVDWDPNGSRNPENRGKSGYVRISWDEALEIIVGEIRRVIDQYGPTAILAQADGHGETRVVHCVHGCMCRLLDLLGGPTLQYRNVDSWEGWYWGAKHVWGFEPVGQMHAQSNLFPDIAENTELLLFWGCDPETTPWGFNGQLASRLCYWYSELGIKSVYVCPDLNYGAAVHADKWIPIRPNTDAALQLSIAYTWIKEGSYDKDYIATHAFGFDKFEEYVVGEEDGIAKTPEWAAEITGVPARIIRALAREWAAKRTTIAHGNGGPFNRGPYATEPARLEVMLLGMQGLGRPGCHQVKMIEWGIFGNPPPDVMDLGNPPHPRPKFYPNLSAANRGWAVSGKECKQFIPKDLIHDALLHAPISWYGVTSIAGPREDQFVKYHYPAEGCSEVHMIWTDSPCWITCWNDTNDYIRGLRSSKVEFILAQHPWLENDCQFADLILPSTTKFEDDDIGMETQSGVLCSVYDDAKCIEPIGEARSNYEIVCMIADKLGLLDEYTGGKTVDEWIRQGFDTSGVQDMISHEKFKEKGYVVVPTDPDWKKHPVGMSGFYEDPKKNPLLTPTGKLEFYSETLAKHFPDDKERPPVAHWVPYGDTHQESQLHPRGKKFPLLVVSNHPRWKVHAQHDDMTWLREIPTSKIKGPDGYMYQPVWMNPVDATARDIKDGEVVKIFNERGAVLAGVYLTERIMTGAISIDHGARYDPIVPGEFDRGGAINTITPHKTTSKNATGMVASGFLAEVEKADLEALRRDYPEAFNRPYDPASGLRFERVMEGGNGK